MDYGCELASTNFSDLLQGLALRNQSQCLHRRSSAFLGDSRSSGALAVALDCRQNLPAEECGLALADAGNGSQLLNGSRHDPADLLERCVMQDDKRGNSLFFCGHAPPLAQILGELAIGLGCPTRACRKSRKGLTHRSRACGNGQPRWQSAANIARLA